MKSTTLILLVEILSFISLSHCGRSTIQTVDDWQTASDTLLIVIDDQAIPSSQQLFTVSTTGSIIGQERDLELRAMGGDNDAIVSISSTLELSLATPTNANGGFLLQYDGLDQSMDLNPTGLNHLDLTAQGADALQIFASTDHPVNALVTITSDANRISSFILLIEPSDEMEIYEITFEDFLGNADFSDVGSISIAVAADFNVDLVISLLSTSGPDRVYFINPTCGIAYNFKEECFEDKRALEQTSSPSDSTLSETEEFSLQLSVSVVLQQYFSFTWNNVDIEEKTSADFHHLKSSGSTLGLSLLAATFVFLL